MREKTLLWTLNYLILLAEHDFSGFDDHWRRMLIDIEEDATNYLVLQIKLIVLQFF